MRLKPSLCGRANALAHLRLALRLLLVVGRQVARGARSSPPGCRRRGRWRSAPLLDLALPPELVVGRSPPPPPASPADRHAGEAQLCASVAAHRDRFGDGVRRWCIGLVTAASARFGASSGASAVLAAIACASCTACGRSMKRTGILRVQRVAQRLPLRREARRRDSRRRWRARRARRSAARPAASSPHGVSSGSTLLRVGWPFDQHDVRFEPLRAPRAALRAQPGP